MKGMRKRLDTPFAKKFGGIILFATAVLLVANPELVSILLLVNMIGVDVFVLLIGLQLRQHWSIVSVCVLTPLNAWWRKGFKAR